MPLEPPILMHRSNSGFFTPSIWYRASRLRGASWRAARMWSVACSWLFSSHSEETTASGGNIGNNPLDISPFFDQLHKPDFVENAED